MQGPVTSVAIDCLGRHMATAGVDGDVKIWDVRNFKTVHTYFSHAPATNLRVSQQGLLAVGFGSRVQVTAVSRFLIRANSASSKKYLKVS